MSDARTPLPTRHRGGLVLAAILLAFLALAAAPLAALELTIDGRTTTWDALAYSVMPGDTLRLSLGDSGAECGWAVSGGRLSSAGARATWVAPRQPGTYPLTVSSGDDMKIVNLFVLVPYDSLQAGKLHGFRIGRYPASNPFPNFVVPRGFIEVTEENIDTRVSPSYVLREFVPRQPGPFPKYMVLQEDLLVKLEVLNGMLRDKGYACTKAAIFSGYRTPAYHNSRGSGKHSAHVYGGAADIYLDANNDSIMDDINHDGEHTSGDSRRLAALIDELEAQHPELVGGCGWYRANRSRGPFVHVDVRGERTRWHE